MFIVAVSPSSGTEAPVTGVSVAVKDSVSSGILSLVIEIGTDFVDSRTPNVTCIPEVVKSAVVAVPICRAKLED